jgi:hypothetical protein
MTDVLDRIGDQLERSEQNLWATAHVAETARPGLDRRTRARPRWLQRNLILAMVLVGLSGTAGAIAIAASLSSTAISPQAWVDGHRVTPAVAMSPDQTAHLAILRRPRVASDALPAADVHVFTASPAAGSGPNVALSRSAEGLTGGSAWLIPGNGMICFIFNSPPVGGGATCQPNARITTGRFPVLTSGSMNAPGMTALAGVVPDGVAQVTLNTADDPPRTVPVHENVYLATVRGHLTSVMYQGPNGQVTLNN